MIGDVCTRGPDQQCSLRTLVWPPLSLWYVWRGHGLVVPAHPDLSLPLVLAALRAGHLPATWSRQSYRTVGLRLASILQNLDLTVGVYHFVTKSESRSWQSSSIIIGLSEVCKHGAVRTSATDQQASTFGSFPARLGGEQCLTRNSSADPASSPQPRSEHRAELQQQKH